MATEFVFVLYGPTGQYICIVMGLQEACTMSVLAAVLIATVLLMVLQFCSGCPGSSEDHSLKEVPQ
jgi:hypothetical protein